MRRAFVISVYTGFATLLIGLSACLFGIQNSTASGGLSGSSLPTSNDSLRYPEEKHLRHVRQLTFGGNNAEAYFSFDGQKIVFQSDFSQWGVACDQIFYFELNKGDMRKYRPNMISPNTGRTTCAYFLPGDSLVLFASTHEALPHCPPPPPRIQGKYVWPIYDSYDIYIADLQGNIRRKLTHTPGYDAEATISPRGDKIVFTSMRSGDLDLWIMNIDGSQAQQITHDIGYDGGAFFSPDGKKIVFRASRPKTTEALQEYKALLAQGLVQPTEMEIFVYDIESGQTQQITQLGKANWAPFFHPSGKKILFSSNHAYSNHFRFNLYMINLDGSGLEQITYDNTFDAFPMFSPDGKQLIFSSNRFNGGTRDTNIFIADWVD